MKGTPFSAAWSAAWMAGQVASMTRTAPDEIAAVKRGAGPCSPRLIAEVSIVLTAPAPIRRSACSEEAGRVTRCKPLMPRRINARVASIATPPYSGGTTTIAPSAMLASASSRLRRMAVMKGLHG